MKIFDAHMHIIDPRFPLSQNQGFKPDPFTKNDYFSRLHDVNIIGGAVVSGSFQGFDQSYLVHALKQLGPSFVGVTQLPADTSEAEILRLHQAGVRAVRFNVKRGGSAHISHLEPFAKKVFDLVGWHTELYIDGADLPPLIPIIDRLPAVSIDHLGLSKHGLPHLLRLVEKGVRVKATGFGRLDFDPKPVIKQIYDVNPNALMFGTDLPSTRAKRPFQLADIDVIFDSLEKQAENVLYQNALNWYRK
ncbi:amidohydrolase family protein [Lentibacillus saliphilus]|uniref:amidohydrolase family protein n=1 Tax=Lentibacillus saliphilus TaxID=2737028 RepID=UPI001C2F6248|nr:amidohydrolase family protein [Lentibacillus saliphilus]